LSLRKQNTLAANITANINHPTLIRLRATASTGRLGFFMLGRERRALAAYHET
jgi:hypothetical protein